MNIGSTIRNIREERGLSQEQFAELFHVTRQTVSNWENDHNYPDLMTVIRISNEFNVPIDTILKDDVEFVRKNDREVKLASVRKKVIIILTAALLVLAAAVIVLWDPWQHEISAISMPVTENMSVSSGNGHYYDTDPKDISNVSGTLSGSYEIIKEKIVDPEEAECYVQMWDDPDGHWSEMIILDSTHVVYEGWLCRKTDGDIDLDILREIYGRGPE